MTHTEQTYRVGGERLTAGQVWGGWVGEQTPADLLDMPSDWLDGIDAGDPFPPLLDRLESRLAVDPEAAR